MKTQMKNYWSSLNDRERLTLGLGVVFCICYLFYLLVYAPLTRAVNNASARLSEKKETLQWMQEVRQEYKVKKMPQVLTSSKLLTVLADSLNKTSFKQFPYQLQQTGVSDIQLVFEQVPYNAFIVWLWNMSERYIIVIKQLNIEKTETAGVVKLSLIITG